MVSLGPNELKLNIKLQLQVLLVRNRITMAVEAASFHDKHLLFPDIKYAKFILQILKSNILFIQRSPALNHQFIGEILVYKNYSDYIIWHPSATYLYPTSVFRILVLITF